MSGFGGGLFAGGKVWIKECGEVFEGTGKIDEAGGAQDAALGIDLGFVELRKCGHAEEVLPGVGLAAEIGMKHGAVELRAVRILLWLKATAKEAVRRKSGKSGTMARRVAGRFMRSL